jgi:hypothetical protein
MPHLDLHLHRAHHVRAGERAGDLNMRTVFIGFSFEQDRSLAAHVETLLDSHGIRSVTGEVLGGGALTPAVEDRIAKADAFVGLLTARTQLPNGEYTTHGWVRDELVIARLKQKPAVALVDHRVALNGAYQEHERIRFDTTEPLAAFLKLSLTISEWKRNSERLIRVRVLPDSLSRRLRDAPGCQFRITNEGKRGKWQHGELSLEIGGLFAFVRGAGENSLIELRIRRGNEVWASLAAPQWIHLRLRMGV